jgi:hypothetical protein
LSLHTNYNFIVDMDPSSSTAAPHSSRGTRTAEREKEDRHKVWILSLATEEGSESCYLLFLLDRLNLVEARDTRKSEAIVLFSAKFWVLIFELLRYNQMREKYDQATVVSFIRKPYLLIGHA